MFVQQSSDEIALFCFVWDIPPHPSDHNLFPRLQCVTSLSLKCTCLLHLKVAVDLWGRCFLPLTRASQFWGVCLCRRSEGCGFQPAADAGPGGGHHEHRPPGDGARRGLRQRDLSAPTCCGGGHLSLAGDGVAFLQFGHQSSVVAVFM